MRGRHDTQATMLALVDLEERVPTDHLLRTIKTVADEAIERLCAEFRRYVLEGGPSVRTAGTSAEGIAADLSLLGAQ